MSLTIKEISINCILLLITYIITSPSIMSLELFGFASRRAALTWVVSVTCVTRHSYERDINTLFHFISFHFIHKVVKHMWSNIIADIEEGVRLEDFHQYDVD